MVCEKELFSWLPTEWPAEMKACLFFCSVFSGPLQKSISRRKHF